VHIPPFSQTGGTVPSQLYGNPSFQEPLCHGLGCILSGFILYQLTSEVFLTQRQK